MRCHITPMLNTRQELLHRCGDARAHPAAAGSDSFKEALLSKNTTKLAHCFGCLVVALRAHLTGFRHSVRQLGAVRTQ